MSDKQELAKLQTLRTLLGGGEAQDGYMAEQIKRAIDFSLTGSLDEVADMDAFAEAAKKVLGSNPSMPPGSAFHHIGMDGREFDPLWIREELMGVLKKLTGCSNAVLLVTGLKAALCPKGRYFTRRQKERYGEAVKYIDELAADLATPNTRLNIIYV